MTAGLIGRERQLRSLRGMIDGVCGGRGGLILVTGEPGVGKTALVTQAVQEARDTDLLVLIASCWESETAPGYWPWTQVLRQLRRRLAAEVWAAIDQPSTASINALLGETRARPAADGDFAVYDAVATALVAAAQTRPVIIVIDDLHWCDVASLRLLDFVARHTWHERILTIGTYRDDEVDARTAPAQHLVGQLTGRSKVIALTGLPPPQVGELISRLTGVDVTADVADRVSRQTGGNPFFIEQAARLWSGDDILEVPLGVRYAIRARLDKLPSTTQRTLATAAIFGPSFNRTLLAAVCGLTTADLDGTLQQAVSARLIVGAGPSRMRFVHDLIRETLYLAWEDDARAERHAAVIGTVDQNPSLTAMISPSDLARHAFLGLPHLAADTTVRYLRAAARDAASRLAFAEAAECQRQALTIAADPRLEVCIALDLATALYYDGDRSASARSFDNACTLARVAADAESLARVALTAYRTGEPFAGGAAARSTVLRAAYRRVGGPGNDADQDPHRQAAVLVDYLETRARARNDDESLTFCLWVRYESGLGVGNVHERAALMREITTLSQRSADPDSQSAAASLRWVALIEQGDADYVAHFEAHLAAAAGSDTPRDRLTVHVDRAIVATLTGHFGEAEEHVAHLEPTGKAVRSDWDMMGYHLRWASCLLQGRFPEAEKVLRELGGGDDPYRQVLAAVTALEQGDPDHAVQYLAQAGGPESHPRYLAPLVLRLQAQAGAARTDASLMEQAWAALVPLRGSWLVSLFGCDVSGPADLWLATIDLAQRRWDDAIDRFREAREQAQRLRARPWSTLAGVGLVKAHLGRGSEVDAAAVVEQVRRDATGLGMIHVLRRIQRLLPAAPTVSIDGGERTPYEFRWNGTTWCLTYDSHTVHLPDAKGLRDLHLLLSRPHTAVPVATMLNPAGGPEVVAAVELGGDLVLDAAAARAYRKRLGDLDDLIDQAILDDHRARVAGLEKERAALLEELRTAGGLAGRTRRLGVGTERARKTVGARIRDALRRMEHQHPPLAAHFRGAVSTGVTCCYRPRSPVPWRL
ncbi:ATP-binding protein [Salinispora vitiensis]|uniref:ATP-binding protein n=1 Tax=Salinispora vitiensis TaxID=999544 RepID=UPI00039DE4A7|nr:AAA family ATPase [Salinispora vitiensis]